MQRFKEDYLEGRRDIGATEKIFRHRGAFQYRNDQNDSASFGFDTLVHKGAFVDGSNWGDLRGWELAVAEERRLLKDLHTILEASAGQAGQMLSDNVTRQPSGILGAAAEMTRLLADRGFRANLVVVATSLEIDTLVSLTEALTIPKWQLPDDIRTNWILGKYENCPVLYINDGGLNSLYVVDVPRLATLVQFHPLVDLHVLAIDQERARTILEERPDLKLDLNTVRSMVHLRLYQSYAFETHEPQAVWVANFSD